MSTYDSSGFRFERPSIWHMIVGHRYVTVWSIGAGYGDLLNFLAEEMGDEFVKPIALISVATLLNNESNSVEHLDLYDYRLEM